MAYVYRADHVGGLVSPGGGADEAAVKALFAMQREIGVGVFTDGLLRRTSPCSIFLNAVSGVQAGPTPESPPHVADRLVRQSRLTSSEVEFLKKNAGAVFKICLPTPTAAALCMQLPGSNPACYPRLADVAAALADVIRQEIHDLIADGVKYIQLDAPAYESIAAGSGFESVAEILALDAAALSGVQKSGDISLAVHLPRGAAQAGTTRAQVLEAAFGRLPADRFLIEFDNNPQDADFEPLRALSEKKIAVLGLVDPVGPRAGEVDPLLDKVDQAGKFISTDWLALSPQRSFIAPSGVAHEQQVKAQRTALMLTVDATRRYWGIEL